MAFPIRQRLSALTCLKAGPKAVLMEVCELHENGGRGCFISNPKLAEKLGVSLATVTRTVSFLVAAGLLASDVVKAEANRRYLSPAPAVRACYTGKEADQLAAVSELTIVKNDEEPELTIVKTGADYSQNSELTIVKNVADYSQNASRVYGDDQDDQLDDQDNQPAALALAQKKIEGLSEELAEAVQSLKVCRATITDLRAQLETEKKKGGANRVATSVAALPYTSAEFAAKWQAFRVGQGIAQGSAREAALLESLQGIAAADEATALSCLKKSIEMGWKTFYKPDEPRPQHPAPTGVAGHGQRLAPPVHANPFGLASAASLAIATAVAVGGQRGNGIE